MKSIISHLHQTSTMPPDVRFLYTVRWPSERKRLEEVLFYNDLRAIAESRGPSFDLQLFITNGTESEVGSDEAVRTKFRRISHEDLMNVVGGGASRESTVCYICGVPSMTDDFVEFLRKVEGLDDGRVLCERWW